jgi:hypothetical protein
MHRLLLTLVAGAAALCAQGQSVDPLRSGECAAARDVLEHALDDASAKRPGARGRLAAARKDAVAACLGRESGNPMRSGAPEPPIVVPAPVIEAAPVAMQAPALAPPPAPPVIQRPAVVTACDAAGCWDSEGRRLNKLGAMLVGPRGTCRLMAGVVQCP